MAHRRRCWCADRSIGSPGRPAAEVLGGYRRVYDIDKVIKIIRHRGQTNLSDEDVQAHRVQAERSQHAPAVALLEGQSAGTRADKGAQELRGAPWR
jgi:hypothetical protein